MRILVADDEPEMAMVLEALLKREHYSVDVVYNGRDALDYGLAKNYDCLVLDIMMPKLDGIQALRALREKHITTPVLLLTAKSQVEDRVAGLDSGAEINVVWAYISYLRRKLESVGANVRTAALDRQTVVDTIRQIIHTGAKRGYVDHYRFGIFPREDGGSTLIVLDCFLQLQAVNNMLRITVCIFLACALTVFVLLLFLSRRAIRPFADNLERQRQFVTDASHELKTPLTILSADLGLLEDAYGSDPWLESAKSQITRLDKLIKNLVELARTEENIREDAAVPFSVSEVAQASADAFQPLAEAAGKTLSVEIAGGLTVKGVPDNFFRLFSILLDNAVKYCDPGGTIRLEVVSQRGRNICISISNLCAGVDKAQLPRYFDRFYRADSSRARSTGGYGIGLSTAKAIVTRYKGRISNHYADGVITFTAVIPQMG